MTIFVVDIDVEMTLYLMMSYDLWHGYLDLNIYVGWLLEMFY